MYGRSHKDYDYQGEWNDDTNHPELIMQSQTSDSDPKRLEWKMFRQT